MKRLEFRSLSAGFLPTVTGDPWPAWVQALRRLSGVYVIRDRVDKHVRYVGESHTGRLKKTLLRHFQLWSGKTAGVTYSRGDVEIAVQVTPADLAVRTQNKLISRLDPRDNMPAPAAEVPANPF